MEAEATVYYLDVFEKKAIEARQLLHQTYGEVIQFKNANIKYVDMGEINFYNWKINQERIIEAKSGNCRRYLEYFYKGYFESCAHILEEGWETKPSFLSETN